jgi:hypothetical protein
VLLPFSLIGLLFGFLGALGFTPFVTAFVFWRNAVRACARAQHGSVRDWGLVLAAVGLVTACGGPLVAHGYVRWEMSRALALVVSPDRVKAEEGVAALRRLRPLVNLDVLVFEYEMEEDEGRRGRLASAYEGVTGGSIHARRAAIDD